MSQCLNDPFFPSSRRRQIAGTELGFLLGIFRFSDGPILEDKTYAQELAAVSFDGDAGLGTGRAGRASAAAAPVSNGHGWQAAGANGTPGHFGIGCRQRSRDYY